MTVIKYSDPPSIRIGTWNTEWAGPGTKRGIIISEKLAASNCDVVCVTEGFAGILPDGGHVIDAGKDWGYTIPKSQEGRRKVLLWSKQPWTPHIDAVGSADLPKGRFVAGITETLSGACLTVVGVCIPWRDAKVKTGLKAPWEDHQAWLAGFGKLRSRIPKSRTIVLGDFNQRIPSKWVPHKVHEALLGAFHGFHFATKGVCAPGGETLIDHIAHTSDLTRGGIQIWNRKCADETRLSDHLGVWCDFSPD